MNSNAVKTVSLKIFFLTALFSQSIFAGANFPARQPDGDFARIYRNAAVLPMETASLSGKVRLLFDEKGIAKARIVLIEPDGNRRVAISNPFGFYRFDNLIRGGTYQLNIEAKGYDFNGIVLDVDRTETVFDIIAVERKN
jgi:hypothetical protein